MKFNLFKLFALIAAFSITLTGCSDEDVVDNREHGHGYIQFKLYKEASYTPAETRAVNSMLENLSDAHKRRIEFLFENSRFSQTMILNSYNTENAEYGLRTEKLKLVAGPACTACVNLLTWVSRCSASLTLHRGSMCEACLRDCSPSVDAQFVLAIL